MARWQWRLTFVMMALLVPVLVSPGCVRSAERRAELDLLVGDASADGVRFIVEDGLAAVHEIDGGRLDLWAQAPTLDILVDTQSDAHTRWQITIENVMPDAELTGIGEEAGFKVVSEEKLGPTTLRWTIDLQTSQTTQMRIAPPDADDGEPFRFAVLSDIQDEMDDVDDFWRRMNRDPSLRFVVSAGDITQKGEMYELIFFMETLEMLEIPFYTTIGNHEVGPASPEGFHELYGRVNFQFQFKGVYFTWIDSASATVDPIAYDWLEQWLKRAKDDTHIFLTHIPPLDPSGIRNGSFRSRNEAAKLMNMLGIHNVDLGLYGHIHSYYADSNATVPVYISGGGGALPEKFDGIGRHYLTVDYDPAEEIESVGVIRLDHE
jgi:predicted phosphodiesterase